MSNFIKLKEMNNKILYEGGKCQFWSLIYKWQHDIRPIWENGTSQKGWYCNKCGLTIEYVQ